MTDSHEPRTDLDDAVRGALHDYWTRRYGPSYDHDKTDGDAIELAALIRARLAPSKDDTLRAAVAEMFTDPVTGRPTSGWYCTNEIADRIKRALAATDPTPPQSRYGAAGKTDSGALGEDR